MSHTQIFDLLYTTLCHLIIKFLVFKIFEKKKKKGGMHSNRVTATTELMHVTKGLNKYLLFRPHISVEYNNISFIMCSNYVITIATSSFRFINSVVVMVSLYLVFFFNTKLQPA